MLYLLHFISIIQIYDSSSRQLAEQLEVSERTIHRDMEALSTAGFPVYSERGSKGGWILSEGYRTRLTGMTMSEIRALLLMHSSSVVRDLGLNSQVQTAFDKLLSALPSAVQKDAVYVRQRIHVDGAGWHSTPADTHTSHLSVVQEAVWEERKLRIQYRGWESETVKETIVCPLGLVAKQSIWYVVALMEDLSIRTYRISRLLDAALTDALFVRPVDFELAAYWEQSTSRFKASIPRYPARVRVTSAKWSKFTKERYVTVISFPDQADLKGWIEADVEFNTLEFACEILLSYGRHAQALFPEELTSAIHDEIVAMNNNLKEVHTHD